MDEKYNIFSLSMILQTREKTLQWLRQIELIPTERFCSKHIPSFYRVLIKINSNILYNNKIIKIKKQINEKNYKI